MKVTRVKVKSLNIKECPQLLKVPARSRSSRWSRVDRHGDNIPARPRIEAGRSKVEGYDHLMSYAFWLLRKQPEWSRVLSRYTWQGDTWPDGFRESELRFDLEQEMALVMLEFKKINHLPTKKDAQTRIMESLMGFMKDYGLMVPVEWDPETGQELGLREDESVGYDDRWPWRTPFKKTDWMAMRAGGGFLEVNPVDNEERVNWTEMGESGWVKGAILEMAGG